MNKKILILGIVAATAVVLAGCSSQTINPPAGGSNNKEGDSVQQSQNSDTKYSFPGKLPDDQIQNKKAVIKTDKGTVEIELWADKAPLSVSNFVYLVNQGFYNGLTFHRVEPGFVVQGGDPQGTGMGGPGYQFSDEPVQGEYTEGTVAMANSGPNTNGSQFFIDLVDNSQGLSKSYNLFGQVTSGMDVVKKIAVGDKMNSVTIENAK